MNDYEETVRGRVVDPRGGAVPGARVEVYDKDLLLDDFLGTATTGEDGRFQVGFNWSDFRDGIFEDRPDIFVKIFNPATGRETRSKTFYELSGELAADDGEEVMDLGDLTVD